MSGGRERTLDDERKVRRKRDKEGIRREGRRGSNGIKGGKERERGMERGRGKNGTNGIKGGKEKKMGIWRRERRGRKRIFILEREG